MDSDHPEPEERVCSRRITRRDFIQFAGLTGLSLSGLTALLAACAPQAATTPAAEATEAPPEATPEAKILKIRLTNDISNVDPAFHPSTSDTILLETISEGLVGYKPGTWDVMNLLAETIEPTEDGLQIAFKLREGVQFHGGYGELTAEDIKFSYERFIDPELDAPYRDDWGTLERVEVTGTYTGIIHLKEPFAPLWVSTLPIDAGMIVSKKAMEEKGEAYATSPIGTGPYEFVEWVPNQHAVVRRFEGYRGEPGEWDEIHFIPIVEDSAAEIALETGEIDCGPIAESAVDRFDANANFEVVDVVTMNYSGILMNVQHPNLEDINIRQAVRYAIDVPAIIEAAHDGKAARSCEPLAPGMVGYWEDAPCYERDVEKAKQFLADAGVDALDLNIAVGTDERSRAVAEIVQANLAEVGINLEIDAQDEATYWDAGFGEGGLQNRQLAYIEWTIPNPDPSWVTMWFTCDQLLQWNWMYWCSEEYDEYHYAALKELDPEKRAELYIKLQQVWDEGVNVVWTVHPMLYFAVRSGLQAAVNPAGIMLPKAFTSK